MTPTASVAPEQLQDLSELEPKFARRGLDAGGAFTGLPEIPRCGQPHSHWMAQFPATKPNETGQSQLLV